MPYYCNTKRGKKSCAKVIFRHFARGRVARAACASTRERILGACKQASARSSRHGVGSRRHTGACRGETRSGERRAGAKGRNGAHQTRLVLHAKFKSGKHEKITIKLDERVFVCSLLSASNPNYAPIAAETHRDAAIVPRPPPCLGAVAHSTTEPIADAMAREPTVARHRQPQRQPRRKNAHLARAKSAKADRDQCCRHGPIDAAAAVAAAAQNSAGAERRPL